MAAASTLWLSGLTLAIAAHGDVFYVQAGGVDDAAACIESGCSTQTFELDGPAEVFGRLDLDTTTVPPTLGFDLTLWNTPVTLVETVAGTEDNGVATIDFSDVAYSAAGLPVTETVPGSFSIDFGATASVEGDEAQWDDADLAVNGTPAFFSENGVQVTGSCLVVAPGDASCSLTFGTDGFALSVGDPTPEPRSLRHTMNLVLLPEPDEALLLVAGVLGVRVLGRRRIAA